MQAVYKQDFTLKIQQDLYNANCDTINDLRDMNEEEQFDYFQTATTTLPSDLLNERHGHYFYTGEDGHFHATGFSSGCKFIGNDLIRTDDNQIMLEFIIPDPEKTETPDKPEPLSDTDAEKIRYYHNHPNVLQHMKALHYFRKSKNDNKKLLETLKSFESLDFKNRAVFLRRALEYDLLEAPDEYPYTDVSTEIPPETSKETSTTSDSAPPAKKKINKVPKVFSLESSTERTTETFMSAEPPKETAHFQKISLYIPQDNFVESILKFSKACDLIRGTIKTPIHDSFQTTLVNMSQHLNAIHYKLQTSREYTCLPALRIKHTAIQIPGITDPTE